MKRRASQRQTLSVSLFPFLAVLICTMGVIIVMLVIVVRQATARANVEAEVPPVTEPQGPSADEVREHQEKIADFDWQREVLEQQRVERVAELAKLRQQLAHVEDHLRRLQEQARDLLLKAKGIDEGHKLDDSQLQAAKEELARKQSEIAAAEEELAKLKENKTTKDRWYALLPYDGPNGTRRRPVYIECTEAGIILQPEGLVLMPDDFNGPLGPGNPLDAVLKAKREYLERNGERGLPYPLLIVRPDGIVAYMAARAALKSWEEEFGYELIDADKKLLFGEPDPALRQTLTQTVRQARQRQAMMAVAMPNKYQPEDNLNSFNTHEVISHAPEMQLTPGGIGNGTAAGRGGGVGSGGTGMGGIGSGPGMNFASAGGNGTGSRAPDQPLTGPYSGNASQQGGTGPGTSGQFGSGTGSNGYAAGGTAAGSSATGGASGGSGGAGGNVAGGNTPGANSTGAAGGANASSGSGAGGNSAQGMAGSQWNSVAGGSQGASGGTSAGGSSAGGSSAGGASAGGSSASGGGQGTSLSVSTGSSATGQSGSGGAGGHRGHNWGLLNSNGRTVAVSRPIRVSCQAQQIAILPDLGDSTSPVIIPLTKPQLTDQEVIAFVQAVQKRIEGWGVAAENGFWRPQLSMDVASNADPRFLQWEQALQGSGYEIIRKRR